MLVVLPNKTCCNDQNNNKNNTKAGQFHKHKKWKRKQEREIEANVSDGNAKGCSDTQVALNHRHTDQNGRSLVEDAAWDNFQHTREDRSRREVLLALLLDVLRFTQTKFSSASEARQKERKKETAMKWQ